MRSNLVSSITAAACLTLAACADSTGPAATRPMSVSFSSSGSSTVAATLSRGTGTTVAATGSDVLVINSAELVIARVELQGASTTCAGTEAAGDDTPHADDGCAELELAPSVVNVPVNGSVASALTVGVPAGSYSSLEAKIRPVSASSGGGRRAGSEAFLAAHPDLAGVSVRVRGTFNGTAFTYTGAAEAQVEQAFSPALVVDAAGSTTANVTVQVDLAGWFRASSGALIDPSTANAGGANASVVADNVKRSFRAFRDDDRDGTDDRGHDGAGHH